jgi:hypothetical protein
MRAIPDDDAESPLRRCVLSDVQGNECSAGENEGRNEQGKPNGLGHPSTSRVGRTACSCDQVSDLDHMNSIPRSRAASVCGAR